MAEIEGIQVPFLPAGGVRDLKRQPVQTGRSISGVSFEEIFREELIKLKFSGHAQTRMISREISLSEAEMLRLQNAVSKAEQKGATETLILFNDKAFVVAVPNRTVITVFGKDQMETNVITNIDSAVIA